MEFNIEIKQESVESDERDIHRQLSTSTDLKQLKNELENNWAVAVKTGIKQEFVESDPRYLENQLSTSLDLEDMKIESDDYNSGFTQEQNKTKIMETFFEHSSYKGHYMSQHIKGKTMNKNVKVQTTQGPYNCEICCNHFSRKSNLKRHLITHTEEKPFKCEICFKQFSQTGARDLSVWNIFGRSL
ncbi:uncharacterized protein [Diabrotica undecimpunctata]|uniref:uncharacterized protein isoform X3 n=1 Tax=Diabrotica undecimpunctata TaxID=50387 RepID=UPI003B6353D4